MKSEGQKVIARVKRQQMARLFAAEPMRPYSRHGDRSKAIEYARWLAQRDGLDVSAFDGAAVRVDMVPVQVHGYKSPEMRATAVHFGRNKIAIPHWNFDPTLPAVDLSEPPEMALAA